MSDEVISLRLDDITVAIRRDLDNKYIYGTGFVVDRISGLIVTCDHVVRDALGSKPTFGSRVAVYFPKSVDALQKIQ